MIRIRPAVGIDAPGIARVHVGTWRTTYKGIVPDEHLATLSEEKRAAFWGKYVADLPTRSHVFAAVDAVGQVIGFTNGGVNRETGTQFDGEVMAIYLLKEHQGSGVGRRLLQASIDQLAADGFKGMMVWVLADNPACGFYARMGGKVVGEKTEAIGGRQLKELAYGWDVLPPTATGRRIFHIVESQAWQQALATGEYRHRSLEKQGFIHCSKANQVVGVADHNFRGQQGLVLLEIAECRLVADMKYENLDGGDDLYPHIYGALNVDAIIAVHPFEPVSDGSFRLPGGVR